MTLHTSYEQAAPSGLLGRQLNACSVPMATVAADTPVSAHARLVCDRASGAVYQLLLDAGKLYSVPALVGAMDASPASPAQVETVRNHTQAPAGTLYLGDLSRYPLVIPRALAARERLILADGLSGERFEVNTSALISIADGCVDLPGRDLDEVLANYRAAIADGRDILASPSPFASRRIAQRLEETEFLPPMPETAKAILAFRQDPAGGAGELASIVGSDAALSAQILGWARSAFMGAGEVKGLKDAINRVLGVDRVVNVSLGIAINDGFGSADATRYHRLHDFWRRSIYCALMNESLVRPLVRRRRWPSTVGSAHLCGLLHPMGDIVLSHVFPQQMMALDQAERLNAHLPASLVQWDVIGLAGEQIGAYVLRHWCLPREIVESVLYALSGELALEHCTEEGGMLAGLTNLSLERLTVHGMPATPVVSTAPGERVHDLLEAGADEAIADAEDPVVTRRDDAEELVRTLRFGRRLR